MKRRASLRTFAVAAVFVFAFLNSSIPAHATQFTADLVITAPDGNYTFKLYVKDHMYRLEKVAGGMKFPPYPTIVNRDTGLTWGLNAQVRQYVELKEIEKTMMMNPVVGWELMRKGLDEKPSGTENLNGYECDKFQYRESGSSGTDAEVWISRKLNHFIKQVYYAANGNAVMELKNISEGPVNEAMFTIPAGYAKMEMPGGAQPSGGTPPSGSARPSGGTHPPSGTQPSGSAQPSGGAQPPSGSEKAAAQKPASQSVASKPPSKRKPGEKAEGLASGSSSGGNMVFILDASGSMWGQVEGKAKIAIAKEVLTSLIRDLPGEASVGLVAYGHRIKGDCNDVEELYPLGPIDKERLIEIIQAINPKGKTPITLSVRMTAEKLKAMEDETTIILVSDGKETCEGDPCALVKELKGLGIKFVMHVIGFDVTEEERTQLECMAEAGGGKYFTAKTMGEFEMAAKEVVEEAQNFGILKVTAIKNGNPFDAKVFYYHGGEEKSFFNETTHPKSGESRRNLSPGIYDIKVVDYHTAGEPSITVEGIEVSPGETVEKTANFSNGILKVTSYMNGEPIGCPVDIYEPDGKSLLNIWTQSGSRVIELLQGSYDIKVTKVDIPGGNPVVWFRGVEIEPDQTVERRADFNIGFLKVTATLEGKPFNTPVKLYKSGTTNDIGHWTSDNGSRTFPLVPGLYDAKVVSIKDNKQFKEFKNIEIVAEKTETIDVAFPVESVQVQGTAPPKKVGPPVISKPSGKQKSKVTPEAPLEEATSAETGQQAASTQEPEKIFGGKIPVYGGATVKNTTTVGGMTTVEMEADASPGEIVDFYKNEMKEKGWNVITSVARDKTASAAFSKENKQLIIGAQRRGSKTAITLSLREM